MAKTLGVSKKIVVVGSSNTDMVIKTPRLPRPGETIIGGEFFMAAGGKGANQAVAAARAGGDVYFIARVGEDVFGRHSLDGFVRDGIHIEHIILDKSASSGIALIIVAPDGENSIAVASGANANLGVEDVQHAKDAIASADIVLMQLESPFETVIEAAEVASAAGVPVILNPAPAQVLGESILKRLSYLTPNKTEAEIMTGITLIAKADLDKTADMLLDKGMKGVLITLGPKGVYVATPERKEVVRAFPVTPVDTTAAGDAFNGALAVALAEGRSLIEAARFGNAAAAIATTKLGAQPSLPFRKDIERLMAS
ncbi:MAG: ribokinase [Candidatus Aminicenantales bacterium]